MSACQYIIPLVYLSSVEPTVYHSHTLFFINLILRSQSDLLFVHLPFQSVYPRKISVHLTHCLSACQFIHRQARRMNIDGVESNCQVQFSSTLDIRLYLADFIFFLFFADFLIHANLLLHFLITQCCKSILFEKELDPVLAFE